MNAHPGGDFDHIALTRTGSGKKEQWGLLVWSSDMAYPRGPV